MHIVTAIYRNDFTYHLILNNDREVEPFIKLILITAPRPRHTINFPSACVTLASPIGPLWYNIPVITGHI